MSDPSPCYPVILLPGIKCTELVDEYPTSRETVWSVSNDVLGNYKRLAVHPDDRRYERIEPARVAPGPLFNLIYEQFLTSLRHELSPTEDRPTPVFAFPYDWRRALGDIQTQLDTFIDEVIARTLLLRHYYGSDYRKRPRVNLVGHSMGGSIVAGYLAQYGAAKIGRIATLAAPLQGSANAVLSITTGQASLTSADSSPAEREVARMLPSVYHMLPSYAGALTWPQGLARSFFKPLAWQPGVYETIAEYIRLYSRLDPAEIATLPDRIALAAGTLSAMLNQAQKHRAGIDALNLKDAGLAASDWLGVVGIGEPTVDRIAAATAPLRDPAAFAGTPIFDHGNAIELDLRASAPVDDYDAARRSGTRTGDSTVPLVGATPTFLPYEQLVAVTRHDFAWWELGDRLINGLVDLHATLPRMNAVQAMVVAHFLGRDLRSTQALPAPGVATNDWRPPLRGLTVG